MEIEGIGEFTVRGPLWKFEILKSFKKTTPIIFDAFKLSESMRVGLNDVIAKIAKKNSRGEKTTKRPISATTASSQVGRSM